MKQDILKRRSHQVLALIGIVVLGLLVWRYGPLLQQMLGDRARLQAFVEAVGWFGPIMLILFNALQIVVAPIPGYIVQLAAGYLYGPWWGGLWGAMGLYIGSMSAMWLARTFGRPLVAQAIGAARIQQFEDVIHSDSIYVWFILLLGPTGDAPYYLAGLSSIRFAHIFLITSLLRVPSAFVAAAIGAGAFTLTWWQFTLIVATVGLIAVLLFRHKAFLTAWLDRMAQTVGMHVPASLSSPDTPNQVISSDAVSDDPAAGNAVSNNSVNNSVNKPVNNSVYSDLISTTGSRH